MHSPLLKKAEDKAVIKKDEPKDEKDSSESTPPAKKLCTVYAKQINRLPPGDHGLVKEIFGV